MSASISSCTASLVAAVARTTKLLLFKSSRLVPFTAKLFKTDVPAFPPFGSTTTLPLVKVSPATFRLLTRSVPAPSLVKVCPVAVNAAVIERLLSAGMTLMTALSASAIGAPIIWLPAVTLICTRQPRHRG